MTLNFFKNIDKNKYIVTPILLIRPWEKENTFIRLLEKEKYEYKIIPVAVKPREEGRDHFRVIRVFKLVYKIMLHESYDLMHSHGYFADIVGIPIAKLLRLPVVSTCHGFIRNNYKYRLYNILDFNALKFADRVIAVSESIKEELHTQGISEKRITVIENAMHAFENAREDECHRNEKRKKLFLEEKDFLIGFVGRLSEEKGVNYLIEAMAEIYRGDDAGFDTKAVIIGDGPKKRELMELAKYLKIEEKVLFLGFQDNVEEWIPAMDIFVLPSLTEGTPMSLLEAMSHGKVVIATAVGGVPRIIEEGYNGILIAPRSKEDIRKAVLDTCANKELRIHLSQNAVRTVIDRYNVQEWVDNICRQYESLIHPM